MARSGFRFTVCDTANVMVSKRSSTRADRHNLRSYFYDRVKV
jgi:hypothetical protein